MSERLTREEIESLRVWRMRDIGMQIHPVSQVLIVDYMLRLHDTLERLRKLQAEDVMDEQLEAVQTEAPEGLPEIGRPTIASVMRGMLASLDKPADSA